MDIFLIEKDIVLCYFSKCFRSPLYNCAIIYFLKSPFLIGIYSFSKSVGNYVATGYPGRKEP